MAEDGVDGTGGEMGGDTGGERRGGPGPDERLGVDRHPASLRPPGPATRRRHRRWTLAAGLLVAVALVASLLGFGLSRDPTVVHSVLVGKHAPAFALPTADGERTFRLADYRGHVVVVNFWASWCVDCRVEHPALSGAWDRYRDQGVVFLGIPFEDRMADSLAYVRRYGGGWPILSDAGSKTALSFGVYGVPETFVISPSGVISYKRIGPVDYDSLTDQIQQALHG